MGSRGLGLVQRILMGSHSEEIVHHSRVPVLVIRGGEDTWPTTRIVIGEDFSDAARRAGDLASAIGGFYGLRGLLVYAHPDLPDFPEGGEREQIRNVRDRDENQLKERPGELEGILGSQPEARVSDGYPASVLLEEAGSEERPFLVAVGSRGLAGITRTRLGSVSTEVVMALRGPVLVCPRVEKSSH